MLKLSLAVKLMRLPHPETIKEGLEGVKTQAALREAIGILDNNGFQTAYFNYEFIKVYTAVRSAENLNMICGYLYTENWKWVKFGYAYTAPKLMENALAEFIGRAGKLCPHGGEDV